MDTHDIAIAAAIVKGKGGGSGGGYTKAETDALLDEKQDTLTTAQLAAVNSGITAADVEQIGTNVENITELKGDVEDIIKMIEKKTVVYGFHVNPDESDPSEAVTYMGDAIGMTPAAMGQSAFNYGSWQDVFFMPKPCMLKYDGTVDYYLDPNDYSKKADGTSSDIGNPAYNGNAMMEWGLIWYKWEQGQTDGEGYFYVANRKIDDTYHCWSNYDSKNNIIPHFYTAIYNGTSATTYSAESTYAVGDRVTYSNAEYKCITAVDTAEAWDSSKWEQVSATTRLRSLSGIQLTPANGNGNTSGQTEIARATANNTTSDTEWYIDLWADRVLITGLLYLMGKSLDLQGTFGRGLDSGSQAAKEAYVSGTLDDKGLFWGVTANGNRGVKVFGMENFWGCVWHRTAGFFGTSTGYAYKLTHGTVDGSTATAFGTTATGYIPVTAEQPTYGSVSKMSFGKYGLIANNVTGGATNKYYCDYFYRGVGFALVGGASYNGLSCGFSVGLDSGVGIAYWSYAAAPSCKPLAQGRG